MLTFDVIISMKDRTTVQQCVASLNQVAAELPLRQILICDGGSQQADCLQQLQAVQRSTRVQWCDRPHDGFNKGWLINQGLLASQADIVLISDVDIIWNRAAILALMTAVDCDEKRLACVRSVIESAPRNIALMRPRYNYRIDRTSAIPQLEIYPDLSPSRVRPGCGLVCARRSGLLALGGYRADFQGWGWEDQDLLIRAQLCGYSIQLCGEVLHLSHDDRQRNAYFPERSPQQSRDRNIQQCLARLAIGNFSGDLGDANLVDSTMQSFQPIKIVCPPELNDVS
jgi:glycosyltransferase involved in cell wall biosynthesis